MKGRRLRWLFAIGFFCCLWQSVHAQESCAVQAGPDATYCLDDLTFDLEGSFNGDLRDHMWSGPSGFNILSPTSTSTTVDYSVPPITAGTYEFYFGGYCNEVWEEDTVAITLVEVNTPVISWNGVPEDGPITVCHSVTLTGTVPIGNEVAEWLVLENYNVTVWHVTTNNDNTEFTFEADEDDNANNCSNFTFVYVLDNNGCRKYDTIHVEFLRTAQPIEIAEPDPNESFCGDTVVFLGSGLGCAASAEFTFIQTPNGIEPELITEGPAGYWRSVYDFTMSGSGYYTVVYSVDATAPCAGGTDTVTFFICVTDLAFGDTWSLHLFCGGLPTTGTIVNTNPAIAAGCDPQPWISNPGAPDVTISGNTYTINNPNLTEVIFDQVMECQTCDLPNGDQVNCWPNHRHIISTGPEITLEADTVLLSCGGTTHFFPYDYVDIESNGASFGHGYSVIYSDAPLPCAQVGDSGGPGNFENLSCEGTYVFRVVTQATGANGITCRDTAEFTVIVQTLDPPCAGVQSDICLGDTVCLDGCTPNGPADIHWEQIDMNPAVQWLTSQDIEDPCFIPTAIGTYSFEYSYSRSEDCYLADTLTFAVKECLPCDTPMVTSSFDCIFDDNGDFVEYRVNFCFEDPGFCYNTYSHTGPPDWHQFGHNFVTHQTCLRLDFSSLIGYDEICVTFYNDDDPECAENCDSFTVCQPVRLCECTEPAVDVSYVKCLYDDQCNEVYAVHIKVEDPLECHEEFSLATNQGIITVNSSYHSGGVLMITGTLTGVVSGSEVCVEIQFENENGPECPLYCDTEVCFETPSCPCRVTNLITDKIPQCIDPQKSYCLTVEFDYCGPEGPMDFTAGPSTSPGIVIATFYNQATSDNTVLEGHNVWTLCFSFFGPCADELSFEYIGSMQNAKCGIQDLVSLRCCCSDHEFAFTDVECFTAHGQTGYSYTLVIDNAQDCGEFSLSTNGNEPSLYGWFYLNGDLVINGSVFGLTFPGSLCVDIDFLNEDCCDIHACTKLPCCCQVAPLINIQSLDCKLDQSGNPLYDFSIQVGNPNGWAENYDLTVDCGNVSSSWVNQGNSIIVSGTISNVIGDPGDVCCFNFDFLNCNLCDVSVCDTLPPCECVEDITVVFPECVRPGEEFCVTYNFNYYGPPTSGVSSLWYIAINSSDPGWTMTAPSSSVPISYGPNSVEVCLVYDGDCIQDGINLVIRGDMYTPQGVLCCTIRDEQALKCCCDCSVDIQYCFDPEQLDQILRDLDTQLKSRNESNAKLYDWVHSRLEQREPCQVEPCCPICEAPDYQGLVMAIVNCPNGTPDGLTYLWNTGDSGPVIIGTYPGTYSVVVSDPSTDCIYQTTEDIICGEVPTKDGDKLTRNDKSHIDNLQLHNLFDNSDELSVKPNPVNHTLFVHSTRLTNNDLLLINQFGQVVHNELNASSDQISIDVSALPDGLYFAVIRDNNGVTISSKMVVVSH